MTRSAEFGICVKRGVRAAQPDLVVHALRDDEHPDGPRIGFVVSKAVGSAVDRHRVARQLRHAVRTLLDDLGPADRVVIRALPGSRQVKTAKLQQEVRSGIQRTRNLLESSR